MFRYIALRNFCIHCIRISLFSLSIKASLWQTQAPHFSFLHFLSLFLPYLIGFSSFSLLLPHAFLLLRVLLCRHPLLLRYPSTLLLWGPLQISPPGVFWTAPMSQVFSFSGTFLSDRFFYPIQFMGLWLLCLWLFLEVALNVYFLVWLVKDYYLGFKWWILWIFVFLGGSDERWEEIQSFFFDSEII